MRGLGAVFDLFSKLTPGNADDPICLSSSDEEGSPPPPPLTQAQRVLSALSSRAKGKQRAIEPNDDLSDASAGSNISISDILTASQEGRNPNAKNGTPRNRPLARKSLSLSTSPAKDAVDLTVDSDDEPGFARAPRPADASTTTPSSQRARRTSVAQPSSLNKSSSSVRPPAASSSRPIAPKSPTAPKTKQQKLSSMFKDTSGAGSWSNPTPLVVPKKGTRPTPPPPPPKPKAPAGPPPGTWGNPEPLLPPRKRTKESSVASTSDNDRTPAKRAKTLGKTTARKSVGGQRMMAALAAKRAPPAAPTFPPASSRLAEEPSEKNPSPRRTAPSWNTQSDPATKRSSREPQAAESSKNAKAPAVSGPSANGSRQQSEASDLPELPTYVEGQFSSPTRLRDSPVGRSATPTTRTIRDMLGDDHDDLMGQIAEDPRILTDSAAVPATQSDTDGPQQTNVEPTDPEPDAEIDELGSDEDDEKTDEVQLPPLPTDKGNLSATSEDGELVRTPIDDGEESDDDAVARPIIEVPAGDTETYIDRVLHPERDIEVILGPDPPKEPSEVLPFGGQAVPVASPRPLEQPPAKLRGKARREVGEEITEYNLTMRNLTANPELQCEVFASYIGQATAHDEPFAPEIRVVNKVDPIGKPPPFEFVYSNEMLYHEGVPDPELGKGCDCEGPCDPESKTCSCVKRQELYFYGLQDLKGFAYDSEERVKNTGCAIWECSETCGCPPECLNRVISRGRKIPVELFKTTHKGWGVKAKTDIKRGQFVGVYAGEMIPDAECESRGAEYEKLGRTYLFDLDGWHISNPPEGLELVDPRLYQTAKETQRRAQKAERSGKIVPGTYSAYSADAFHTGNFTRFINHSCDPNLVTTQAYFKDFHPERPCLVIIARRAIRAGEELCISYKGEPEDVPLNWTSPLMPVTSHTQSKTSAKAHFSPSKISASEDHCRCGAYNCDGKMFSGGWK